nr:hypothetical protein [Tanacetum cinerariifolium]
MSRDVLTVGSTMRIPLLYRGEYSQWVERFTNYLEEQTVREAMINSIKNGDQPLPRVTQVSIAGTSSTEQPPLNDKSIWSDQEKRIKKIDRLARSLLIQGLLNDTYSLIDSNKTAKDLWDALVRHMLGSEYGEQDRKAAVLYESVAIPKITIADQQFLYDKMSVQLVEFDKHVRALKNTVLEKDFKISELEECVRNKNLEIEKCLERLNVCENKLHKMGQTNQTVYMIMPSKDNLYNGYWSKVHSDFLTHSDEALEIEKFKRSKENKIEFAYDYGNLNASYVNEKINFEDDYFQEIINPDFENIDSPFQQTSSLKPYVPNVILENIIIDLEDEVVSLLEKEKAILETIESLKSKGFESSETVSFESENQSENNCHVVEKQSGNMESSKVIAPRMFKLNVSHCVSPISMSKLSCDSKNVEIKIKRKRRKRKSSKQNVKRVDNDVSRANSDFVHLSDLDTFSSVRRPKHGSVVWKKKKSSNTSNVGLTAVSVSNLNKNVKRYSRKDLLACNNSHLGETSSAYMCNDAMNVSCNPRLCDVLDDNNFFIFDDENVRISLVSKMPFRTKPRDSMHVRSKNNSNKSLSRTVHKWLPKLQLLAEPVTKWFPRVKRQI